jgi:hypothetical protein
MQHRDTWCWRAALPALLMLVCTSTAAAGEHANRLPAFPGAEGFGAGARGGRGGRVIEVTTLEDYQPASESPVAGSLRAALAASGPRTVVFRVGGWIDLKAPLRITESRCTVAGQTAPGGGIGLRGDTFAIGAVRSADGGPAAQVHDVIVRHLRIRCGPGRKQGHAPDALAINNASAVIVDHCSIGWGVDECLSITAHPWADEDGTPLALTDTPRGDTHNITIQWSIVSEGLYNSTHPKGHHSRGLMCTYGASRVSIHHNLMAHNNHRNPNLPWQLAGPDNPYVVDVVNNLVYNWRTHGALTKHDPQRNPAYRQKGRINFVANNYRMGPDSRKIRALHVRNKATVWARGNIGPHRAETAADEFACVSGNYQKAEKPFDAPPVTTFSAERAAELVLQRAGATAPRRDAADRRVVEEVRRGTGEIIDDPNEVGGWPALEAGEPAADGDHDGMPNAWEAEHGFDPNAAADGPADTDGDGYTNLEEYLNETDPRAAEAARRAVAGGKLPDGFRVERLVYSASLADAKAVAGWRMEGPGTITFKDGWMHMRSPGEKMHHVYWCPKRLPDSFVARWQAQNLETDAGLCIVFLAAAGRKGQSIFDEGLPKRDGTFSQYTKGAIRCYHTSYYANAAHNPDREQTNLRKNPGFHLVATGREGVPTDSKRIHTITLAKQGPHIRLWVDRRKVIDWTDKGNAGGEPHTDGFLGLRQMKWTHFRYRNLEVWSLHRGDGPGSVPKSAAPASPGTSGKSG